MTTVTKPIGRSMLIKSGTGTPSVFTTIANMKTNSVNRATGQIDATDKSSSGFRELLAGGVRTCELSGAGVVSDAASLVALEAAYDAGTISLYAMFSGRGDSVVGNFQISAFNRTGDDGAAENFTATFLSSGSFVRCLAVPVVTSLDVVTGSAAGGTAVTITGTGFVVDPTGALIPTVQFGAVAATSVIVLSATQISCVTPAHAAGAVTCTVTNQDGRASNALAAAFTYA